MKKLETFVNEKLKVSKKSPIILDTDIYEIIIKSPRLNFGLFF